MIAAQISAKKVKETKMSITVKPYLLIGIVNGPSVGYCCNLKGNAPDVAICNGNNVFQLSKKQDIIFLNLSIFLVIFSNRNQNYR